MTTTRPPGASCVAAVTAPLGEIVAELADSVEAGRSQYSGERMEACLRAIGEVSCDRFGGVLDELTAFSACDPPFTALVADGGACGDDHECTSAYCAGRGEEELGACAALPGEGDLCPESRCADGLYCDDVGTICIPQRSDGEECASADQCRSGDCTDGACGPISLCDGQG